MRPERLVEARHPARRGRRVAWSEGRWMRPSRVTARPGTASAKRGRGILESHDDARAKAGGKARGIVNGLPAPAMPG